MARTGYNQLKDRVKEVVFDLAFVIEGRDDSELPEQCLCSVRARKLDPKKSVTITP